MKQQILKYRSITARALSKLLYELLIAHAVTDYALQGAWMAEQKQAAFSGNWAIILLAHSIVNGGGVYVVTGSVALGVVETLLHFIIDLVGLGMYCDQAVHLVTKVVYAFTTLEYHRKEIYKL